MVSSSQASRIANFRHERVTPFQVRQQRRCRTATHDASRYTLIFSLLETLGVARLTRPTTRIAVASPKTRQRVARVPARPHRSRSVETRARHATTSVKTIDRFDAFLRAGAGVRRRSDVENTSRDRIHVHIAFPEETLGVPRRRSPRRSHGELFNLTSLSELQGRRSGASQRYGSRICPRWIREQQGRENCTPPFA